MHARPLALTAAIVTGSLALAGQAAGQADRSQDLAAFVYDPAYQPPTKRALPEPDPEADAVNPPVGPQKFSKKQVAGRLRQLKVLYEDWLLTDGFYLRKVAECEAAL